ncbi:hypothetical protein [Metabacillus litoralis]|uniref:hypothetical protein n=1 Tax=Metabacillus litoralis TaxID=152268 RepID=UPI00214C1574|nr:hypothetical protein [Metabacillus litoralis]
MTKIFMHITRLLLGVIFFGAGLNGYFVIFGIEPFIATSTEAMALFEFKYLLIVEKSLEVLCGILLLMNRFVPLTLAILTPIIVNILLLHLFLDHSLLPLAIILVILHCYLLYLYRNSFKSILEQKPTL